MQAATPDAVLSGVELLADGTAGHRGVGDVVVVDVGGGQMPRCDVAGDGRGRVHQLFLAAVRQGQGEGQLDQAAGHQGEAQPLLAIVGGAAL